MGNDPPFLNCPLPPSDSLKNSDSTLLVVESLNIHQVGGWTAMLGDQHGAAIFLNLGDQACRLALEGGYEFCFHGDTIVALLPVCQSGGERP